MIKKWIGLFMALCILFSSTVTVYADGDANIDIGGGGMGNASSTNYWSGNDGVRVTVVRAADAQPVTNPIDLTNSDESGIKVHFGKVSKLDYKYGSSLKATTSVYQYYNPSKAMPRIVTGSVTKADLEEIKAYFCSEYAVKMIAEKAGIPYKNLISGEYKLLLEPIAYMVYEGIYIAMTAHEAALYNEMLGGGLRSKMISLSHKNLPLAMFLAYDDLGLAAWEGSKTEPQSDSIIKSYLGAAIVKFSEEENKVEVITGDYQYRCNTDVITSVYVSAGTEKNPDNPMTVTFSINGVSYVKSDIYIPEGSSQLVWCKWHTPSVPTTVTINVSVSGGTTAKSSITAQIVDLTENTPKNPTAKDTMPAGYTIPTAPSINMKKTASWSVWDCYWKSDWKWVSKWNYIYLGEGDDGNIIGYWEDNGYWKDYGKWIFYQTGYYAELTAAAVLTTDEKSPTAANKVMKSGYGVNMLINSSSLSDAGSGATTGAQNAMAYFPEFNYQNYWRVLERTSAGYYAVFQFYANPYSTYNNRVHFTPLCYPDGKYTVSATVFDMWTPTGMLSCTVNDTITINGTLYSDWHIAPKN